MSADMLVATGLEIVRSGQRVLTGFELRADAGAVVALVGPNGAGKSSALKALAGLLPYRGEVQVQGRELRSLQLRERARAIAYVPQQSLLRQAIPVHQVIEQGRYAHDPRWPFGRPLQHPAVARAIEATDLVGLTERRWDQLSGGEQRRVLLARALATEAPVVLLDEPTVSLDVGHALRFLHLMRQLAAAGRCIVVALHDLQLVRHFSDRALLLERGRLVASGAARDIITTRYIRPVYGVELDDSAALGYHLAETR